MLSNVPQFLDIEDKIVGPLTAKQLGWLGLGGVVLFIFYTFLDTEAFFLAVFICAIIFGALAFYKPYNQPLISFIGSSVFFVFRPRIYVWKRMPEKINIPTSGKNTRKNTITKIEKKKISGKKVAEISKILDQR